MFLPMGSLFFYVFAIVVLSNVNEVLTNSKRIHSKHNDYLLRRGLAGYKNDVDHLDHTHLYRQRNSPSFYRNKYIMSNQLPFYVQNEENVDYHSSNIHTVSRHRLKRAGITSNFIQGTPPSFTQGRMQRSHMSFEYPDYQATCDEDVPIGEHLITAKLKSVGSGDQIEINVTNDKFTAKFRDEIVNISTADILDYDDNGGFYMFVINVKNKMTGEIAAATIRVFTRNKNDEAPRFTQVIYSTSVDETARENTLVATVVATDKDGDKIFYSFASGNKEYKFFKIDEQGVIRLHGRNIEFDEDKYELNVTATDDGGCCEGGHLTIHTSTAVVVVSIIDVNDNKPVFEDCENYKASVEENKQPGTHLITVTATDKDRGLNGEVEYSVVEQPGQTEKNFDIDKFTGEVVTKKKFDREIEGGKVISLTVKATDKGKPQLEGLCTILVQILDINDNYPQFDRREYLESVPQNKRVGDSLFRISATDIDSGENSVVQYGFNPEQEYFSVSQESGIVTLKKSLDRKRYSFKAVATDKGQPPLHSEVDVIIDVVNLNIQPPEWEKEYYSVQIKENIAVNSEVLTVQATSNNEKVMYRLIEGNTVQSNKRNTFILQPAIENNHDVGKIRVNAQLDYEDINEYNLTVRAELSGDIPLASETQIYIKLIDVNDEVPLFTVIEQASVLENEPENSEVVKISAYDRDGTDAYRTVYYNLTEGYDYFSIGENDGLVRTKVKFDREKSSSYRIMVEARDGAPSDRPNVPAGQPNRHSQLFRITIGDINDNPPKFDKNLYEFNVKENEDIGHPIGTITATDADESSRIHYQLPEGNKGGAFGVQDETGTIFVAGSIDYETRRLYELTLVASDGLSEAQTKIKINVQDVNDLPPKFKNATYKVTLVEEDENVPQTILKVSAVDGDKDRPQDVVYFLSGPGTEEPEQLFTIDKRTGDISVLKPLDRDQPKGRPEWRFTVLASDEGGGQGSLSGYAEVIVLLRDINDNAPFFPNDRSYEGSVTENQTAPGELALVMQAVDYDDPLVEGNAVLTYEITKNAQKDGQNIFQINSKDATIRTDVCCLDRERIDKYAIIVTVQDGGGHKGTGTATINVKDINDNPPSFDKNQYMLKIDETNGEVLPRDPILVVKVLDKDLPETNNNYFTIVKDSGPGWDRFAIFRGHPDEGLLKIRQPLDYENPKHREGFSFKIQVDDLGGNSGSSEHTATARVNITLRDINDNSPVFEKDLIIVNVTESAPRGTNIATFKATDVDNDGNSKVRYVIDRATNRRRHFTITSEGSVNILRELDREETQKHEIRILAIDDGKPSRSSTATLTVNVLDVNDNAPTFCEDYRGYVQEHSPFPEKVKDKEGRVLIIEACDLDDWSAGNGPPFTFSLDSSAPDYIATKFGVENHKENSESNGTAIVTAFQEMDREEQKDYKIPIRIIDGGTQPQTGTSTLTVIIGDINDNPMKDGTTNILVYTFKGKFPKMIIGRVYADDLDDDDWVDKTYTYATNKNFLVDKETGEITMMNGTREGTYVLKVLIHDNKKNEDAKSEVTIRVENIPEEAVYRSGSIRIKGMTEDEFISVWDYKNKKLVESKRNLLAKKIAEIIGAKEENVQVFTAVKSKHPQMLDVRFAAHGSPYYKPEKINGLLSEKQKEIEDDLGIDIAMIGIDECLYENLNCEGSCSNDLIIYEKPYTIISPRTSFVGVYAFVDAVCVCRARDSFPRESCNRNPCYNGGTCIMEHNGVRCLCSKGFDGPRCQQTTRGFFGKGYAWFPPLQQCENSHLSLEFITSDDDGLIFYNGPIAEPRSEVNVVQDFISLELVGGKPRLLLDFGSGTLELIVEQSLKLSDGEWHRIDIYWQPELITLIVDMCKDAIVDSQNEEYNNLDKCKAEGEPVNLNEYLNVNSPLQLGGVRHQSLNNYNWQFKHTTKGFNGCIKNFIHNSEMYDLQAPALEINSKSGCPQTEEKCKINNVESSCINGICVASFNTFHCLCKPGFHGNLCEYTTSPSMLNENSYILYHLLYGDSKPQYISKIQINYRAHFPDGEIMYLQGENKTFMLLEIENSTLFFRYNLNKNRLETRSVNLPHFHANDGYWHTINVARYGTSATLSVDNGGGKYYNELIEYDTTGQFIQVLQNGITLGGHNPYDGTTVKDLYKACLDDVRYPTEFYHFPMPPSEMESQYARVEEFTNLIAGCNSSSCVGIDCPELMECVDLFFNSECRCIAGYEADVMNKCVDINECDIYPPKCLNDGRCHNIAGSFTCECLAPYVGEFCDVLQEKREVKLSIGALAAILICVFVILLLVFVLIIYTRKRSPNYGPVDPDDDIRENIINYNDEGGGEDDMNTYDINPLRIPIDASGMPISSKPGPEKAYKEPVQNRAYSPDEPNVGEFINNNLGKADDDPDALPLDDLRVYAYEGGGSDAGSLSSLASGTDDNEQDFDYLNGWGPRFQKLADMYGQGESEEE